jgi:hypothetical protein
MFKIRQPLARASYGRGPSHNWFAHTKGLMAEAKRSAMKKQWRSFGFLVTIGLL